MPVKIVICDDTENDIRQLTNALSAYDPFFEITVFTSGEALLEEFLDPEFLPDILFLDIYMPGMDGIKTAQNIREERRDLKIIFVSSSNEHYPQAYEVFAFNYILKPFDKMQLYSVLERAVSELARDLGHKVSFSYKSAAYSVDCRDIVYMESRDKLILFHLADNSTRQCYGKLDRMIKELPEQSFIRCHQSFIVNTAFITEMGESHFRLGEVLIGISKKYQKPAKDKYYAYLFLHMGRGQNQ